MITEHKTIRITDILAILERLKSEAKKNDNDICTVVQRNSVIIMTNISVFVNRDKLNLIPAITKTDNEIAERMKNVTIVRYKIYLHDLDNIQIFLNHSFSS
jgi:hypothetical protein